MNNDYPVQYDVEFPDRKLNRLTTFFRLFLAIPIIIVLISISAGVALFWTGMLFFSPLLMILFRKKYPRWWFDWNLELARFTARISVYLALMDDRYPSTDEQQSVSLEAIYPDANNDLNRFLPLVKWLLAIPHYFVLYILNIASAVVVFIVWFIILFTGRYPRDMFDFVVGVQRWGWRVYAYAFLLYTDKYPPFRLKA